MRPRRDFIVNIAVFLSVSLLVSLLAGCGALRLGYANGTHVAYWWMDSYVDFNADQKPWVKKRIDKLFAWHRQTQLKDYARLLARERQRLAGNVSPTQVRDDYGDVRQRARLAIEHALPDLADLALTLEPRQIEHIEQKFASNNETYRKDRLRGDVAHRQQFRFKKTMKQAEYWFGDFSAEQEAKIRAASDARPLNNDLWMAERLRRQQDLIRLLKKIQAEKPDRAAVIGMLREHLTGVLDGFTHDENKAFFDASEVGTAQLVATIVNLATPSQKAHAADRAQELIDDCNTLATR